ncbi:hypothetical protein JI435_414350, partial [Parastagonospora nodorum SN15]
TPSIHYRSHDFATGRYQIPDVFPRRQPTKHPPHPPPLYIPTIIPQFFLSLVHSSSLFSLVFHPTFSFGVYVVLYCLPYLLLGLVAVSSSRRRKDFLYLSLYVSWESCLSAAA